MNSTKKYTLLLFIGFSMVCFSQTISKKQSLILILKIVETRFDVKFSYADKTLNSIVIIAPKPDLDIKETLRYLSKQSGLNFNTINSRFIAIEKMKNEKPNATNIERLEVVFIENYLTKGISKTIDGTIEISPQKFGILPGLSEPDILQTIQTLPGIISADERISNINIRGGTNDQNLILYEGIRMYQTGHFFGLISAFNPYLTDKVNVSTNGTKAKYGSGVSSIISIKNTDEIDTKAISGAGFNLLSIDGFSKFQLSTKTELQLAARRSYTDALLTPTYDSYLERIFNNTQLDESQNQASQLQQNEQFFFYDVSGKFLYDISENSKIRANVITLFNRLNYDVDVNNSANYVSSSKSELNQKTYAGNINYQLKLKNDTHINAQVYYSNYKLFGNSFLTNTSQELTQENKVKDFGVRLDFLKRLDRNLSLELGYQLNEIGVSNIEDVSDPKFRSSIKEVIVTHGLYGEILFNSNSKNTYARVGLRGNYIDKLDDLIFEPRLVFSQRFLNDFRLKISGELKHQSITQIIDLQQDFFGIEKRRWQLADDENVPVVKSNQFSVGINYKKNGWLISAEAYTKNVTGISSRTQGFQNQFQLVNTPGDYKIKGFDLLLNKQFKKLSTWLSYSMSKNDYEFETLNNAVAFANNLDIRNVMNFSMAYDIDQLKLSAGVNWHSGRPFTQPAATQGTSGTIFYDAPNAERLPDYLRTDVSARYSFQMAKDVNAEVGASIWNIFNKKNTINRFYTREVNGDVIQNNEIALGLTPNFSFRLKF